MLVTACVTRDGAVVTVWPDASVVVTERAVVAVVPVVEEMDVDVGVAVATVVAAVEVDVALE